MVKKTGRGWGKAGIRRNWVQILVLPLFVNEALGKLHKLIKPRIHVPPRSPFMEDLLPQLLGMLTADGPQLLTLSEIPHLQEPAYQSEVQRPGHLDPN